MSRGADWYSFHATINPVDTSEALQAALADPRQRWYGLRRVQALTATGALVAASWNPNLHPRGRDGKFIERFGWVRWYDVDDQVWHTGWVSDIDGGDGTITVRSGGDKLSGINPKMLYSRPKPKALLDLPDPTTGKLPDKFVKIGGQGGSNPGALYQIDGSFADQAPDITGRSRMHSVLKALRQPATDLDPLDANPSAAAEAFAPTQVDTVMVPRLDGTLGRYDIVQRFGSNWYRVPASGQVTVDDAMRPELQVSAVDVFGEPGTARRHRVLADLGTLGITRGSAFDVEDTADMVQQAASPLPTVGDKFYVKKMNIAERARSEALANDFYELLGIPVPEVGVGSDGMTVSSKLVGDTVPFNPNNPDHVKAAQAGFVADAWVANWDVIGQGFDNIQIDSDGRAWRVDAGGALEYRAKGTPKGGNFGADVGELDSLRNAKLNPTAGKVYANLNSGDLQAQGEILRSITPQQIQKLADAHDMAHVGPVMIARRKSILDQLGIIDPPLIAEPAPPVPKTVYNPVQAVQQVGTPPTVAVHNYKLTVDNLDTFTIDQSDWENPTFLANHVLRRDGDLWVPVGTAAKTGSDTHQGRYRNVFTGESKLLTVYDDEDVALDAYTPDNVDLLVDQLQPGRDAAVAEIVARTTDTSLIALGTSNVNEDGDPDGMRYGSTGLGNWAAFQQAVSSGRFGKDNDRPLMNGDSELWEIVEANPPAGVKLRRRAGGPDVEINLSENSWQPTGPWFLPNNDTTAAVWKSKYAPDDNGEVDPNGLSLSQQSAISAKQQDVDDVLALLEPGGLDTPGDDDGSSDAAGVPPTFSGGKAPSGLIYDPNTDTFKEGGINPLTPEDQAILAQQQGGLSNLEAEEATAVQMHADADAELEALIAEEQAIADAQSVGEGNNQKLVHGVVAGLSPGTPILSTEMDVSDIEEIKEQLLGKHVVFLPIEAYENPDWEATGLGAANGLGTVTEVTTQQQYVSGGYTGPAGQYVPGSYKDVVKLKVSKPSGNYNWVIAGEATWKKVVIPVETAPVPQEVTLKKNGDVFINGEKAGTHSGYTGVIDGEHSLTGKPMHFAGSSKKQLRYAAANLVVPITPKPTKPKSTKIQATEQEIKDLNYKLVDLDVTIGFYEQQLADLAKGTPVGPGNPLNDDSNPAKGDWVFSIKDGTYAQVLNPNVVGFAGKGVLSPDMIKVKIQDPATGKWKQSNRKRDTLVSAAGPGETPFVLQTKATKDTTGAWIGPGTSVYYFVGTGADATVLDTTSDGQAKLLMSDGSHKWVSASSHLLVSPTATAPTLKTPPGSQNTDVLNAELAALNDEKAKLVATIAGTVVAKPKKKKPVGTPYPGPGGTTYKQPPALAEQREAKGLKNTKDGYVPTAGMILRHNDGTQYVVVETGDEWSSHKNSVRVAPVGQPSVYNWKWRAMSTMVVDHETMLTDSSGAPLPIISTVEGVDWSPESGLVLAKQYKVGYYTSDPTTGKSQWREKSTVRYYIVGADGTIFNADGSKASSSALLATYGSPEPAERIGYLDKSHSGGKKLTVSVQQHHQAQVGQVQYAVIHDPNTPAAIPLAKATTTPPTPQAAPTPPVPTPTPTIPGTNFIAPPTTSGPAPPAPDVPQTVSPTPAGELPAFTGGNPAGTEMPHPPTTSSSAGVPVFQAEGGQPTLDNAGLAGAHSVTAAIQQTLEVAKANKQNGRKDWVGTYSLADHDTIEDMMVRTQTVRDAQGVEYVEVSFRLENHAARKAHTTFVTSSVNEAGDWETNNRNATNLVPGDLMAVRVASGGGAAPKGALRPDENGTMPNVTVVAAPVLIGKNKDGLLDVYRTQVMTAGGDIGYLDLEDRNGDDTVVIFNWDATKPRTSNGNKSLNPNAKDDGWNIKTNVLSWASSGSWQVSDLQADGVKKAPTTTVTAAPYSGSSSSGTAFGAGMVIQRDHQGVHIEYATSPSKNSLDGQTVIRVKADDPDAQRKIAEAMELVGVTRDAQKPPDKAALIKMATNKVYEQFSPTYTRGKTPNSPQDALTAIDNAVGQHLGRKATLDDISVRLTKDGRVQVLVSEDVSKAIVKKNGVKQYIHRFMGSNKLDMLESIMAGESPTLMSTTERFQHGLWYTGMSSGKDHHHDSADHLFLTMDPSGHHGSHGSATIDATVLHRHVDYYYYPGDSFGDRKSDQLNWLNKPGQGELMMQRRFEADLLGYVILDSYERDNLIKKLHARGVFNAPNGRPLEEFFVTAKPGGFHPTNFGDEIKLTSIPDDASMTTPPVPAMAGV